METFDAVVGMQVRLCVSGSLWVNGLVEEVREHPVMVRVAWEEYGGDRKSIWMPGDEWRHYQEEGVMKLIGVKAPPSAEASKPAVEPSNFPCGTPVWVYGVAGEPRGRGLVYENLERERRVVRLDGGGQYWVGTQDLLALDKEGLPLGVAPQRTEDAPCVICGKPMAGHLLHGLCREHVMACRGTLISEITRRVPGLESPPWTFLVHTARAENLRLLWASTIAGNSLTVAMSDLTTPIPKGEHPLWTSCEVLGDADVVRDAAGNSLSALASLRGTQVDSYGVIHEVAFGDGTVARWAALNDGTARWVNGVAQEEGDLVCSVDDEPTLSAEELRVIQKSAERLADVMGIDMEPGEKIALAGKVSNLTLDKKAQPGAFIAQDFDRKQLGVVHGTQSFKTKFLNVTVVPDTIASELGFTAQEFVKRWLTGPPVEIGDLFVEAKMEQYCSTFAVQFPDGRTYHQPDPPASEGWASCAGGPPGAYRGDFTHAPAYHKPTPESRAVISEAASTHAGCSWTVFKRVVPQAEAPYEYFCPSREPLRGDWPGENAHGHPGGVVKAKEGE